MRKLIYALVSIVFVGVQSKVTKLKIADEEGGADWILEIEDDVIKDQYREGVSLFFLMVTFNMSMSRTCRSKCERIKRENHGQAELFHMRCPPSTPIKRSKRSSTR